MTRYRLCLVAATIIWGSSFVVMKDLTTAFGTATILLIRFGLAAVVLAFVCLWRRRKILTRENVCYGALVGLVLFLGYYTQTWGLAYTTPGKNAFLTAAYCVIVPFLSWPMLRNRPNRYNIVAACLCVLAVGLISLNGDFDMGFGDAMTLVCAVFYSLQIIFIAKYAKYCDVLPFTMWQFTTMALCSAFTAAFTEQVPDISQVGLGAAVSFVYLAVVVSALGILLQNIGQGKLPSSSASVLLSLESVFGALFSIVLGVETPSGRVMAGFIVMFAAVMVSEALPGIMERRSARKQ